MRFVRDEAGSELLEVALVLPMLLLLTFGTLELILFMSCYIGGTYGSRMAVRFAAVHGAGSQAPCTAAMLANIVNSYAKGIPLSGVQTTTTWSPNNAAGSTVSVQVSISFSTGIPAAGLKSLTASTTAVGAILQ